MLSYLVDRRYEAGRLKLDHYITHRFKGVEGAEFEFWGLRWILVFGRFLAELVDGFENPVFFWGKKLMKLHGKNEATIFQNLGFDPYPTFLDMACGMIINGQVGENDTPKNRSQNHSSQIYCHKKNILKNSTLH